MICVLSHQYLEYTTDQVVAWLRAWGLPVIRVNGNDIANAGSHCVVSNGLREWRVESGGRTIDPRQVSVVWYRRWSNSTGYHDAVIFRRPSRDDQLNSVMMINHLTKEVQAVSRFFFNEMGEAAWLSDPETDVPNKFHTLRLAADLGLDIPDTLVTSDPARLARFAAEHGGVITKAAGDGLMCRIADRIYGTYTTLIPGQLIEGGAWRGGFPSFFQEKLDKKYEVRSFYLDGKFYSMAIFSQSHSDTSIDFRRYRYEDPARSVPYRMPPEVEGRLRELMKALKLETGSLDIVRTVDGRYVFLEVNPVGQFGMVSAPCNYLLEKKVASALAERFHDKQNSPRRDH